MIQLIIGFIIGWIVMDLLIGLFTKNKDEDVDMEDREDDSQKEGK